MQFKVSAYVRRVFALALVAGFVGLTLSLSTGAVSASPRSGELNMTKECSEYTYLAGGFCTITSSNIKAIEVGARVVYASAFDFGTFTLDSDIVVVAGPGNTAFGHVHLDGVTGTGLVTLSGGTGKFTHLNASAAVSYLGGPNWGWDGMYSLSP